MTGKNSHLIHFGMRSQQPHQLVLKLFKGNQHSKPCSSLPPLLLLFSSSSLVCLTSSCRQFDDLLTEETLSANDSLDDSLITPTPTPMTRGGGGGGGGGGRTPTAATAIAAAAVPDLSHFDQTTPYSDKRIYKKNIDTDEISTTSGVEYNTRRATTRENSPAGGTTAGRNITRKKSEVEAVETHEEEDIVGEEIPLVPIPLSLILHPSDSQVRDFHFPPSVPPSPHSDR
jgi:hypothetical protein